MIKLRAPFATLLIGLALASPAEPLPAPEKDELPITELSQKMFDLDGKIVETKITSASSFEQIAPQKYRAFCYYYMGTASMITSESVLVPEEGKAFFQELAKKDFDSGSSRTVYLFVHSKTAISVKGGGVFKLEAVGTRYRKSTGEYSW